MQLNQFTDIALKSLIYLKSINRQTTINEISDVFSLPKNHLVKVLNFMVRIGWISSIRGRNGGLIYNLTTDKLKLGDAIMHLENRSELLNCNSCMLGNGCSLRSILSQSLNVFYSFLNQYVISDLVDSSTQATLEPMLKHIITFNPHRPKSI